MRQKTLVVGPSWVGDMVIAQVLYKLLHARSPGTELQVLAPGWSAGILARMPEVAGVVELPLGHGEVGLGQRRSIGKRLATQGFEHAIVLPRSAKASLIPWFAGIPRRTGFRGEMRFGLINDIRPLPDFLDQTVKRYCWLGQAAGETELGPLPNPSLAVDEDNQRRLYEQLKLDPNRPSVALLPGAEYGPAKQWPIQHYRRLAERLVEAGKQVWVLGSEKDTPLGDAIADGTGAYNLCGHTSIVDAVDLLAAARVVVSNDSGLMHVAAAVNTHVVAIYGSSSPKFTPPLTEARDIVWRELECSPCFKRQCPLGHLDCLNGINPEQVLKPVLAVAE
jgi:heptosyltransferase-2